MEVPSRRMMCHMAEEPLHVVPDHDDAPPGPDDPDGWLTIDELARETGVTVRNIRAHQARGLLPPPQVRARTGFYGPDHRARLELVQELQQEGVRLDTIKKLLDTTGGSSEQVLHFLRAVRSLFGEPEGEIVGIEDLATRFGDTDQSLLRKATRMGLLRKVDDEQYQEVSPRLVGVGADLVQLGIPIARSLDVVAQLRRHADGIARTYVQLFLDEIWKPFDASGRPADQWPRINEAIQSLRTIAGEAVLAVLEAAVSERLDVTFGREITRNVRSAPDA